MTSIPRPSEIDQSLVRSVSERVGDLSGWDFSRVVTETEPAPWGYVELVQHYLTPHANVLGIGTGGGERLLDLTPYFESAVAIDHRPAAIEAAIQNKAQQGDTKIAFRLMDATTLAFQEGEFDVVLNSHCSVYPDQIAPVLKRGGYFITEQVGKQQDIGFLTTLGWTPEDFGENWWQALTDIAEHFRKLDFHVIAKGEVNRRVWIKDFESLVFYIKCRPWPNEDVEDLDIVARWQAIRDIVARYQTPQGIETNDHLEYLICQKR